VVYCISKQAVNSHIEKEKKMTIHKNKYDNFIDFSASPIFPGQFCHIQKIAEQTFAGNNIRIPRGLCMYFEIGLRIGVNNQFNQEFVPAFIFQESYNRIDISMDIARKGVAMVITAKNISKEAMTFYAEIHVYVIT